MRTEVKLGALFVALVGIPLAIYLYYNSNRGPEVIPIDKSAVDKKVGAGVPLSTDPSKSPKPLTDGAAKNNNSQRNVKRPETATPPHNANDTRLTPTKGDSGASSTSANAPLNQPRTEPVYHAPGAGDGGVHLPPPIAQPGENRPVANEAPPPSVSTGAPPAETKSDSPAIEPPRRRDAVATPPSSTEINSPPVQSAPAQPGPAPSTQNPPTHSTTPPNDSGARTAPPGDTRTAPPSPGPTATPAPAATTHKVTEGDTLIALSRQYYNDAKYWRVIMTANNLSDPSKLLNGATIRIPTKAEADDLLGGKRPPATAKADEGAARPGVARDAKPPPTSDAGRRERELASKPAADGVTNGKNGKPEKNGVAKNADSKDNNTKNATEKNGKEKPQAGRSTYVVGQGDTLRKIAANVLKNSKRWREIYELNKDKLKSPDVVPAGLELRLPPLEKATASRP